MTQPTTQDAVTKAAEKIHELNEGLISFKDIDPGLEYETDVIAAIIREAMDEQMQEEHIALGDMIDLASEIWGRCTGETLEGVNTQNWKLRIQKASNSHIKGMRK